MANRKFCKRSQKRLCVFKQSASPINRTVHIQHDMADIAQQSLQSFRSIPMRSRRNLGCLAIEARCIDKFNSVLMPASFEGRLQPDANNVQRRFQADHSLPQRNHVGIVVLPAQARRVLIPAQRATNASDPIRHHGLAIP